MNRLTFVATDKSAQSCEPINCIDKYSAEAVSCVINRLAAYEDSGLEPEEVAEIAAIWDVGKAREQAIRLSDIAAENASLRARVQQAGEVVRELVALMDDPDVDDGVKTYRIGSKLREIAGVTASDVVAAKE